MKKTHFVQFWASWWHVVPRLFFGEICWNFKSSRKHVLSITFLCSTKRHHCLQDICWIRHNAPTSEVLCHLGQRRVVPPFFSWEFTENSTSSKHEKDTLPFGTRMQPQGNRQDKTKLKATAVGSYNRRSNGYWNSWPYLLLRRSNCYFYSWFRFSRVLVCYIASTLASTFFSFDRSGS